ncbi:MAG: phosphate signaling complex protein PhoU [Defluviitaleaceae bacterium]|nr:phosphate signaling complex protein PhoU [Defluviitaleaceae bacterium]
MRSRFDEQLTKLNDMMVEMGALIEKTITLATQALKDQDVELAKKAIAFENDVDQMEKDIEALCMKLLLQQQPVAKDLRLISTALKMITDMERISDQAADISEIVIMMAGAPYIQEPEKIPQMATATVKMVTDSVDAFVKKDLQLAKNVIEYDDVVDGLFDEVKFRLIELMRADNANGEQCIDFLMIAKYFERIGDHACNIAEWVIYSITGKQVVKP